MIRIRSAEPLEAYRVRLEFTDGKKKTVDLGPYLHGPIFEQMRSNPEAFCSLRVDHLLGTIVWPNGADVDPDVLYEGLAPAWMAEGQASRAMNTGRDQEEEPYYLEQEVIGSASLYHLPSCHVVANIYRRNRKRLRNWQEAVELGLKPCSRCRPPNVPLLPEPPQRRIGFS